MNNEPNKIVTKINRFAGLSGDVVNSIFIFLNNALGRTGKLLSTMVIVFAMFLISYSFYGQIENIPDVTPDMDIKTKIQVMDARRTAFKEAITSISTPLATLAGIIPVIVGGGLIMRRRYGSSEKEGGEETKMMASNASPPVDAETTTVSY